MPAVASAAGQPTAVQPALRPSTLVPHGAGPAGPVQRAALPAGEHYVCPAPTRPGQMECMSIIHAASPGASAWSAPDSNGFYGPSDLRSAYKIATAAARGGRGKTIAIVDAFSDPDAAANLATYRSHYHLGACTMRSGCLQIINEFGRARNLPPANVDWATEESLDLDMVSAICPNCRILLVEARSPASVDLGAAEDAAVAKGARYVSNSWSGGEFNGQDFYDHYFNHPGDVIDFASGDNGYGTAYPTDLQYVTAVGGTSLRHATNGRGWTESVWGSAAPGAEGTASGCSPIEAKPSWQRADATSPGGCLNRTENDVAAIADPNTGVTIYDTYNQPGTLEVGGTSAATPVITAIYALAGTPTPGTYPAEYPYLHFKHLFNVGSGVNGICEPARRYLCHGGRGYNGPTGMGTPNGTGAFTDASAHRVTLVDPGTQDREVHSAFSLRITGLDTRRVSSLRWSATGLPAGLSMHGVAHSTDALITGTLTGAAGSSRITVTAKDGSVGETTHFFIVVVPSVRAANPPAGPFTVSANGHCVDDGTGSNGQPVRIQSCGNPASQDWTYTATGGPTDVGTLAIAGHCLGLSASKAVLAACNGSASTHWEYLGFGGLGNMGTGQCLEAPSLSTGTALLAAGCTFSKFQTWTLPPGPIVSGAAALCMDNPANSTNPGARVQVTTCGGAAEQQWTLSGDGTIGSNSELCLDGGGSTVQGTGSTLNGTAVIVNLCDNTDPFELWLPGPAGQLINAESGKCLADSNNGGPGSRLVEEDCYGDAGEVWGLN